MHFIVKTWILFIVDSPRWGSGVEGGWFAVPAHRSHPLARNIYTEGNFPGSLLANATFVYFMCCHLQFIKNKLRSSVRTLCFVVSKTIFMTSSITFILNNHPHTVLVMLILINITDWPYFVFLIIKFILKDFSGFLSVIHSRSYSFICYDLNYSISKTITICE